MNQSRESAKSIESTGSRFRRSLDWLARFFKPAAFSEGDPHSDGSEQFREEVLPQELDYIKDRRRAIFGTDANNEHKLPASSKTQLLGLALSGGGIRSATFNLGVLQALQRRGILKFVDYLSTVSGGGFLGCSLSSLLSRKATEKPGAVPNFPFEFSDTEEEVPAVSYLRNNSNYLAPDGLLDYLRIFAVLVRGIILNFLVLLPVLLIFSMIVYTFYGQAILERLQEDDDKAELSSLLERNWIGTGADEAVTELIDALEYRGMLDSYRASPEVIVAWLKGDEKRGGRMKMEALPTLIVEDSEHAENTVQSMEATSDKKFAGFGFVDGITDKQLVDRLWRSGTLRNLDALREIDVVEKEVRASPLWESSSQREGKKLGVRNLYQSLYRVGRRDYDKDKDIKPDCTNGEVSPECEPVNNPLLPSCDDEQGGLVRFLHVLDEPSGVLDEPSRLIGKWSEIADAELTQSNTLFRQCNDLFRQCNNLLKNDKFEELRAVGHKPNLRRILQELYARGIYNAEALEKMRPQEATGIQSDGFAYLEPHLLAKIERKISQQIEHKIPQQPATCKELLENDPVENLAFATFPEDVIDSGEGVCETLDLTANDTLHKTVRTLWEKGFIKKSFLEKDWEVYVDDDWGFIKALQAVKKFPFEENLTHPAYYQPYDHRLAVASRDTIDPNLFRVRLRLVESSKQLFNWRRLDLDLSAINIEWNPFRNPLPVTKILFGIGFVWVLLYPILPPIRRSLYLLQRFKGALWWRDFYEKTFSFILVVISIVAFIEFQPFVIYYYRHLQAGQMWWPIGIGVASLFVSMVAGPVMALLKGFGKKIVLLIAGFMGPVLPFLVFVHLVLWGINEDALWSGYYVLHLWLLVIASFLVFIVAHVINLPIDVNSTSLHGFYRDRLSHSYLLQSSEDNKSVTAGEDLQLSDVCVEGSGAPYPLINATLNLQGTKDPSLLRRRGDFFQFSKYYVGSKQTGYCQTKELEDVCPQLYVSTAMAVSAAAAAPNMGTFTSGPLVVLMSLLNIRLGYWIPNPFRVKRWKSAGRFGVFLASLKGDFRSRPGAYLFIREMLSKLRANSRLVNLSDGGHMENTAIYELLRRRCQFIIAGDAEADPKMHFGGLAAMIRFARIDLGIEIAIHVDDIRLDDKGESRQHCAVGVIHYPESATSPAEVGYLLYIKSSITGDEDEIVSEYYRKSPLFPHESTADQFFNEGQFEAYRSLGYHIGNGLFDDMEKDVIDTFEECSEWFQSLSVSLAPGLAGKLAYADIQSEMSNIERMLREPGYKHYFYELYPDLKPTDNEPEDMSAEDAAESFRNVFHLVNIQLKLMESVFVSVELGQKANREHPSNRGWINLFQRWAKAPSFKRAYLPSITTYSAPFQQFCKIAFGLGLDLTWENLTEARREQLARHAGEIGLVSLGAELPDKSIALVLQIRLQGTMPILIGETLIFIDKGEATIDHLNLIAGYKGSGMRARAMIALKKWAHENKLILGFQETATIVAQEPDEDQTISYLSE